MKCQVTTRSSSSTNQMRHVLVLLFRAQHMAWEVSFLAEHASSTGSIIKTAGTMLAHQKTLDKHEAGA